MLCACTLLYMHILLHSRRNRVNMAVKRQWPGNKLPTFKGQLGKPGELDELVAKLLPECTYSPPSLPGVVFGKKAIRQHILDSLNERRRMVHSGYDYENVCMFSVCVVIGTNKNGITPYLQPPAKKPKIKEEPTDQDGKGSVIVWKH